MPQTLIYTVDDPTATQEIWKTLYNNSTDLTVTEGGVVVIADAPVGPVTIHLPAVSGSLDRIICVKKVDVSANAVTLNPNASETIDGATTYPLSTQYDSVTVICDGDEWHVIAVV
jgi:hypothetical protein